MRTLLQNQDPLEGPKVDPLDLMKAYKVQKGASLPPVVASSPRTSGLSFCVSGQTPGGDVEAAGQPGGPPGPGRDPRLPGARRRVGGQLQGRQSSTGTTASPGGKGAPTGGPPTPSEGRTAPGGRLQDGSLQEYQI